MLPDASTPMPDEPAVAQLRWSALALDGYERSMIIGHGGRELCSSTCVSTHDALTGLPTQGDHLPTHAGGGGGNDDDGTTGLQSRPPPAPLRQGGRSPRLAKDSCSIAPGDDFMGAGRQGRADGERRCRPTYGEPIHG